MKDYYYMTDAERAKVDARETRTAEQIETDMLTRINSAYIRADYARFKAEYKRARCQEQRARKAWETVKRNAETRDNIARIKAERVQLARMTSADYSAIRDADAVDADLCALQYVAQIIR